LSERIKKIKINDLPNSSIIGDEDVFIKSNNTETSKIAAGDVAEYVNQKVTVYEWARAKTKPTYTAVEVGADESGSANTAYENAKSYTNTKIAELINGAPTTLDTLGEIADAMSNNQDVVNALNTAIGTKADQEKLDGHTKNTTIHITAAERTNWNDANNRKHEHGNKTTLDAITAAYTTGEKTKLSGIETGAQKNTVTGIKGNAENSYRTGNVNITPANIGLGNVNNTADANKSVALASRVKDAGDGRQLSFNYSANGLNYNNYTWLAVWNGNTLQTANKNQFAVTGHTHDDRYYTESEVNNLLNGKANNNHGHSYLPLSGGTMNGEINMGSHNIAGINSLLIQKGIMASSGYLNLQANDAVQARDYYDNNWVYINARGFTTKDNSSRKLKDNIKDITAERAREILDVKVVTFDYKEGIAPEDYRYNRTGVIAEDTESVCPEVINYDNDKVSGVQYDRFIPYLIKMVQLQQEEIDRLKASIQ